MRLLICLLLLCSCAAHAAQLSDGFTQKPGALLPLQAQFRNERAQAQPLATFFNDGPVILVLGYYHCPRLCSTIMDGVLQSVQGLPLPYTIVGVSIDPREVPAAAARKYAAYTGANPEAEPSRLHLLTGGQASIERLTQALGFNSHYDATSDQYTHPAGFIVATPDGHVSRYFPGLRFDQRDVRLALIEASDNRIGSLSERVVLLCSHYDPVAGRYNIAVMRLVRVVCMLLLIALLGYIWRVRRSNRRGA